MNIAFYSHLFLPGKDGVQVQLHNLATEQMRAGHQVWVILPWNAWWAFRGLRKRVSYRVLPLLPRLSAIAMRSLENRRDRSWLVRMQLRFWQLRYGFDVWHVHVGYPSGVLMAKSLRRMAVPSVLTCHGEDIQTMAEIGYGVRLDPSRDRQVVAALHQYDGVVAISKSIADEYAAAHVPTDRIYSVPNGVDVSRIKGKPVDRAEVRKRYGVPVAGTLLLTVGRNHPKKGYQQIPAIASQLHREGYEFTWLLVGRGTEAVAEQAARLGLGDRVRALQTGLDGRFRLDSLPSDQAIELYRAADLFVFPTRLESFGLVVVEAMAAGLPVIASPVAGVRDIIRHQETGLLAPPGESDGFARAIAQLLDDPESRRRMGAQARLAAERYELQRVAAECIGVYQNVIARRCAAPHAGGPLANPSDREASRP